MNHNKTLAVFLMAFFLMAFFPLVSAFAVGVLVSSAAAQDPELRPVECPACPVCPEPVPCPAPCVIAPPEGVQEAVKKAMDAIQAAEQQENKPIGPQP